MIKEIKYNGYTSVPSDYECFDGELSTCLNLVPENGSINPIFPPTVLFTLEENQEVVYIHKSGIYEHYIVYDSGTCTLLWKDGIEGELLEISGIKNVKKVIAIGHILVVSHTEGQEYFYFNDGHYKYMGEGMPEISVNFSLKGENRKITYADSGINVKRSGESSDIEWGEETLIFEQDISAHVYGEATYINVDVKSGNRYRFKRPYKNPMIDYYEVYYVDENGTETLWTKISNTDWKNLLAEKTCERLKICLFWLQNAGVSYCSATIQIYNQSYKIVTGSASVTYDQSLDHFNALLGVCNRFITKCHEDNKFIYPFYVRYALVMYDGSEINVSAPILMIPNYKMIPFLPFDFQYTGNGEGGVNVNAFAIACDLQIKIGPTDLSEWNKIISGLNVYATAPIITYKQAANYEDDSSVMNILKTSDIDNEQLFSISSDNGSFLDVETDIVNRYKKGFDNLSQYYFEIPLKKDDDVKNEVLANQVYRKIKSYTIEELIAKVSTEQETVFDVELDKGILTNINTLPTLGNTNSQLNKINASDVFSYNNRLILSGNSETMFMGYPPGAMNGCFIRYIRRTLNDWYKPNPLVGLYFADIYIKSDKEDKIVRTLYEDIQPLNPLFWFYYPNSKAYKAIITKYRYNSLDDKYYRIGEAQIKLLPHDYLPGAYWFDAFKEIPFESLPEEEIDISPIYGFEQPVVGTVGKICVSEVNNPFVFDPANTVTLGIGNILAVSAVTKALSQGQFGQFPLYAFATEGVWALEISSTGTISARQPITRDVCINPDSITQIDSAILFATDRGIMLISGSQTQCISDTINNETLFDVLALPAMDKLHKMLGHENDSCFPIAPFFDFLSSCGMIYDYIHQRIFVFSPKYSYAYVYSLKSKQWGMVYSNLSKAVNSYPEALAIDCSGNLIDFSKESEDMMQGLIVTRPMKLGEADILKTVDTVIQRGYFRSGHVKSVLYGSRDLFNWHLINSSVSHHIVNRLGTPYKYFRVALLCSLDKAESVYGCTVQYTPRFTNRPR